jgi:ABC-2 type transport system permease protein
VSWLNVLRVNWSKELIELRRYLPDTIGTIITFYAIFLLLFLGIQVVGDPGTADANIRYMIVSNAFWILLLIGFNSMAGELAGEAMRGTLEQVYMSPVPAWKIILTRAISTLGQTMMIVVVVVTLGMLTSGQWLSFSLPTALLVAVPTLTAVLGIGFMSAGLALVFKQIQSFLQISQFILLGLAFTPLSAFPLLELAPAVKGLDLIRRIMVDDLTLAGISTMEWLSLTANAAFYFGLGLLVYRLLERRALDRGLLGKY